MMDPNHLRMMKSIRATIKTITSERGGLQQVSQNHHLNGTFKQLCNKSMFAEILFPGTIAEVLEELPKNLKEVLEWEDLELDQTKIAKNASEVLENIKTKGKAKGDIMDETTENILLPQIGQEALSKGIIEAVRKLSRKASKINAFVNQSIASTTAPQATQDQLDDEVVHDLYGDQKIGVQREYMGDEWTNLLRLDIRRYMRNEKLSILNKDGGVTVDGQSSVAPANLSRMCWVEPSASLKEQYAALSEVISQLHALPFELNLKGAEATTLRLLEPSKGCTMLLHYPAGSSQMTRIDSFDDGSDFDSGIRITCSYVIDATDCSLSKSNVSKANSEVEQSVAVEDSAHKENRVNFYKFGREGGGEPIFSVAELHDTLILHQSTKLKNERVAAKTDYFVIIFFVQGKDMTT